MKPLVRALKDACEGREKQIALEAFPDKTEGTAKAELSKILGGERGESTFAAIEAVLKFGDRTKLRAYFDNRLREFDPSQFVDRVEDIGAQLDWIKDDLSKIREEIREAAQVIPLRRKDAR